MFIVTGGAGFIGSNIVKALNDRGIYDILVVDDLTDGRKCRNLQSLTFSDYMDHHVFDEKIANRTINFDNLEAVFHQGACSNTMEYDGKYMMQNNFECSKQLFHYTQEHGVPFIYASSASTYGGKNIFIETKEAEEALNPYAFSKLFFDRYIERHLKHCQSQVVGLRYFNVFGPQENHKDAMASVIRQMFYTLKTNKKVTLFGEYDGYAAGEQRRDFIYVKDVVKVNLFFLEHPEISGIYNCGTGESHTFNELMQALIEYIGYGEIEYTPFPDKLKGKYQSYTQADLTKLMSVGYDKGFYNFKEAIFDYCRYLNGSEGYFI